MTRNKTRHKYRRTTGRARILILVLLLSLIALIFTLILGWQGAVGEWIRGFSEPVVKEIDVMEINSPYVCLIPATGGRALAESRADERIWPASMTKIMTGLVAVENIRSPDAEITLTEEMYQGLYEEDAYIAGFEPGETVTAKDLLYGALLPSGAECCRGLAWMVSGSEEAFVELMNKKAARLGLRDTHYVNTIGLHDPEHYTTPRDMAVVTREAIRNRTLREILSSDYYNTYTNVHPEGIGCYSDLFNHMPDPGVTEGVILGGKTGYTDEAGLCLASFARVAGREYILVTAGAPANGYPLHVYDALTLYDRIGTAARELRTDPEAGQNKEEQE